MTADRLLVHAVGGGGRPQEPRRHPHPGHRERRTGGSCGPRSSRSARPCATSSEGDRVLFAPDAGFEVEIRGEEYLILRERDIHAVASAREDGQTGLYL